jgi:hypothetical protein
MLISVGRVVRDLDMFVGTVGGRRGRAGASCVVFPYKFDVPPVQRFGPRASRYDAEARHSRRSDLRIVGALYGMIALGVAHQLQLKSEITSSAPLRRHIRAHDARRRGSRCRPCWLGAQWRGDIVRGGRAGCRTGSCHGERWSADAERAGNGARIAQLKLLRLRVGWDCRRPCVR